jgi:hypothetical protein
VPYSATGAEYHQFFVGLEAKDIVQSAHGDRAVDE